jgi:hypothetical protein
MLDRDAVGRYLQSRRTRFGGYCYYRTPEWGVDEPNAPDTLAALASLQILEIAPEAAEATARWLRALQSGDGGYPTMTIGWAAVRGLALLGQQPRHSPREWADRWAEILLGPRASGEWRSRLVNCRRLLELCAVATIELDADRRGAVGDLVAAAADEAGGRWARPGPDLEVTAVAVDVLELAGMADHVGPPSEDFLRACEDPVVGFRLAPGARAGSGGDPLGRPANCLGARGPRRKPRRDRPPHPLPAQRPNGGLGPRDGAIATLQDTWTALRAEQLFEREHAGSGRHSIEGDEQ